LPNRRQTVYDWHHYIGLVRRKPGALRNGTPRLGMRAAPQCLHQSPLRYLAVTVS